MDKQGGPNIDVEYSASPKNLAKEIIHIVYNMYMYQK
jgi:hypothetical protein